MAESRVRATPDLNGLRSLALEGDVQSEFGRSGARVLSGWPLLSSLTGLELVKTGLTDQAVEHLAGRLGQLTTLDLSMNRCGVGSLEVLLPHAQLLQHLRLGSNPLGDPGAFSLAASRHLGQLEALHLDSSSITDRGVRALLDSPMLPRLRELNLAGNALTDSGTVELAALPDRGLLSLNVSGNRIGVPGDRALRARYGSRVRI